MKKEFLNQNYHYVVGEEKTQINLDIQTTNGLGICGFLYGGEVPHVGGVAYATPHMLTNDRNPEVSCISGAGHKDYIVAKLVAEKICKNLQEVVCICAGIHIDNISQTELETIVQQCEIIADLFIGEYKLNRKDGIL